MSQLVELQEALPKFEAAGIKLYPVSYDEPAALAEFAKHHGITYPLISDRGSRVIRRYGILNTFVTREQVPFYGVPFPGTYLVDEQGIILETFFPRSPVVRDSAESVIDSALGRILLGDEEPTVHGGDDEVRITAALHGGGGRFKGQAIRHLVVRFELVPGLHIYGKPVPEGMVSTRIEIEGPEGLRSGEPIFPPTKPLALKELGTELQVWEGTVDIATPVWPDARLTPLVSAAELSSVRIKVAVHYQACDDRTCRIPQRAHFELEVPIDPWDTHGLADFQGQRLTTMNSARFLKRKVLRGLLRSPLRGWRYLKKNRQSAMAGPAGPRGSTRLHSEETPPG
jgi:peroxiredoxin